MILSTPGLMLVRWFGGLLTTEADDLPLPVDPSRGVGKRTIKRVSMRDLREDDEESGFFARASTFSFALWVVPLAAAWLGWL
jgi:hypothetical protein